jgi:exonuclease SbcC
VKFYEIIENGFSKNGVQDVVMSSLLPAVNEEMSKVLDGVVNFTIELDKKPDDDQIDIYINDGDRRLLELGSGMERFIGSIALRLALHNVSSLPKSDVFIIDEGFGALDAESVEECCTLLKSLKSYFKTVLVVTHVDVVKDVFDSIIDVKKIDKDSKIEVV